MTRPADQAASWVEALGHRGVEAVALPLLGIAPAADRSAIDAAWQRLGHWSALMFVSPNAVAQFFACRPDGQPWPVSVLAASPGPGTSHMLRAVGVPAAQIVEPAPDAPQFDSAALWQVLRRQPWKDRQVLVVRGEGGRDWLAEQWQAAGAQLQFLAAYQRVAPSLSAAEEQLLAEALARPELHLWLFSSSEAIDHLQALVASRHRLMASAQAWALTTHPRIAARARRAGFARVLESRPALDRGGGLHTIAAAMPALGRLAFSPVSEPSSLSSPPTDVETGPAPAAAAGPQPPARWQLAWPVWLGVAALVLGAVGAGLGWRASQRVKALEHELVQRQTQSQQLATEARLLSQQTQDGLRESAAKVSVLEARLSEVAVQRTQLEDLIQSLSRSRDENIVVDIESALRVAQQQSLISGSAEPLVAVLKQSDERLIRYNQPRLEGVRRAIARDLDRVRKVGMADIGTLVIRLDEAVRMVDELPLLSSADMRSGSPAVAAAAKGAASAASTSSRAASSAKQAAGPAHPIDSPWLSAGAWKNLGERIWTEVQSLVRVTRINRPEAILVAPDQAFFLRENLKLRLLNARLALLSRQFDTAQADLQMVLDVIDRYHDRSARRTQLVQELLRQVSAQARQGGVPRPDDTLAALAAAAAGR